MTPAAYFPNRYGLSPAEEKCLASILEEHTNTNWKSKLESLRKSFNVITVVLEAFDNSDGTATARTLSALVIRVAETLRYDSSLYEDWLKQARADTNSRSNDKLHEALRSLLNEFSDPNDANACAEIASQLLAHDIYVRNLNTIESWIEKLVFFKAPCSRSGILVALVNLLKNPKLRPMVWNVCEVHLFLHRCLRRAQPVQQYKALMGVWILSFDSKFIPRMQEAGLTKAAVEIILDPYQRPKEKALRLVVCIISNILNDFKRLKVLATTADASAQILVGSSIEEFMREDLKSHLQHLAMENWKSEDLTHELDKVIAALDDAVAIYSTFEIYALQIKSGRLRRGRGLPNKFWKENIRSFEHDQFGLIRMLVALVDSPDLATRAGACRDLRQFVLIHPTGRHTIERFNGVDRIYSQMSIDPKPFINRIIADELPTIQARKRTRGDSPLSNSVEEVIILVREVEREALQTVQAMMTEKYVRKLDIC